MMTCGLCHQLSSSYFALDSPNLALAEEIQSTTASHFHFLVRSVQLLIESERLEVACGGLCSGKPVFSSVDSGTGWSW